MHNQNIRPSDTAGDGSDAPRAEDLAQQWSRAFPDLNAEGGELNQTNLILPEPCTFLHRSLPPCSIVRPTLDQLGGAVATINSFTPTGCSKASLRSSSRSSTPSRMRPTPQGADLCRPSQTNGGQPLAHLNPSTLPPDPDSGDDSSRPRAQAPSRCGTRARPGLTEFRASIGGESDDSSSGTVDRTSQVMPDVCLITIPGLEVSDWRVVHDRLLDEFPQVTDVLATTMKETILVVCEDAASGDAGRWLDTVSETIANCRRSRSS